MSGFNSNYFNRHLINDMRNALNSVFIGEEQTSARNLEQWRERQDSQRADRIATGQANNAAAKVAKAERETARAQMATAVPNPATPPAAVVRGPRAGEINTDSAKWEQKNGRPLSINPDGSFNISQKTLDQAQANRNPETAESPPRKRYVNPNSPEGRVEASIAAGKEPDMQRDRGGRIITNDRGVQDPDAVGYAAGQRAFDASIAADARAAKALKDLTIMNTRNEIPTKRGGSPQPSGKSSAPQLTGDALVASATDSLDRAALRHSAVTSAPKPATPASFADTADGVRQSWGIRPSANIPQDPNDGRNDENNFNRTPTAQTTSARTGTSNFNTANEAPFNQPSFNTANEAPPQEVADTAAKSAAEEKEKKRIETTTSARTTSDAAKQYVLDRRLQDERNAEDERAERAARFGPTPRPPSNFVDPSADRDLPMWNGTIGPNGGQRATPAGSTKSTIKPVSLTKPKTPPQTFFPMR